MIARREEFRVGELGVIALGQRGHRGPQRPLGIIKAFSADVEGSQLEAQRQLPGLHLYELQQLLLRPLAVVDGQIEIGKHQAQIHRLRQLLECGGE